VRKDCTPEREKVIKINEEAIKDHLGKLVRSGSVKSLSLLFRQCPFSLVYPASANSNALSISCSRKRSMFRYRFEPH